MEIDRSILLIVGVVSIVIGAVLLVEFIQEFFELIAGLLLVSLGISLVSRQKRPKVRIR